MKSVSNAGSLVKNSEIFSPKISKHLSDVHPPSVICHAGEFAIAILQFEAF